MEMLGKILTSQFSTIFTRYKDYRADFREILAVSPHSEHALAQQDEIYELLYIVTIYSRDDFPEILTAPPRATSEVKMLFHNKIPFLILEPEGAVEEVVSALVKVLPLIKAREFVYKAACDVHEHMYFILEGRVQLTEANGDEIRVVGPGDCFGEMAVIHSDLGKPGLLRRDSAQVSYIYADVYICVYVLMCIHIYTYTQICIFVYIFTCIYRCIYMDTYAKMYIDIKCI